MRRTDYSLERGLPASVDAERSILGAIMLGNTLAHEALSLLRVDDFSLDAHRRIYAAIASLVDAGEPVDMITLAERLDRRREVDAVGGVAYLSLLIDGVPDRPSIAHYCKIVREKAVLRAVINIADNAIAEAIEHTEDSDRVLSSMESSLLVLRSNAETAVQPSLAAQIVDTLNAI